MQEMFVFFFVTQNVSIYASEAVATATAVAAMDAESLWRDDM